MDHRGHSEQRGPQVGRTAEAAEGTEEPGQGPNRLQKREAFEILTHLGYLEILKKFEWVRY